jgi:hypothetical protein
MLRALLFYPQPKIWSTIMTDHETITELTDEQLDMIAGGLTASQIGQRGDAVPAIGPNSTLITETQAFRYWTGTGGWHGS